MGTIGITGAAGQLGFVCRARLQHHFGYEVKAIDHQGFNDDQILSEFLDGLDAVLHLAGVNRGSDVQVSEGNPAIARRLVEAMQSSGCNADIIYASSIQVERGNIYGDAKRRAGDILETHCNASGAGFYNFILPNLFGEFSRPNYNNVTATFCHQIAGGETPTVENDSTLELMHYVAVADEIAAAIHSANPGEYRPKGYMTSVSELAKTLQDMHDGYFDQGVFPDLRDPFHLSLFNAYRQTLIPDGYPRYLTRHADARGSFFECIREKNGGQVSFSTTVPGVVRGQHFHFHKVERFVVLSGQAKISMRKIYSEQVHDFIVDGDKPCFVDMPTLYTHNLTNVGDSELTTLFWTHDFFDPEAPDTYPELVESNANVN